MSANFGGTELGRALTGVLSSRRTDVPSSLFVLTDGEVSVIVAFDANSPLIRIYVRPMM